MLSNFKRETHFIQDSESGFPFSVALSPSIYSAGSRRGRQRKLRASAELEERGEGVRPGRHRRWKSAERVCGLAGTAPACHASPCPVPTESGFLGLTPPNPRLEIRLTVLPYPAGAHRQESVRVCGVCWG